MIKIAVFCGGRGATNLIQALFQHSQVHLTLIVNAYDDGLSTGQVRRLFGNLLGPSDLRKNISHLMDESQIHIKFLKLVIEYRFSPVTEPDAVLLLNNLYTGQWDKLPQEVHQLISYITVSKAEKIRLWSGLFLERYRASGKVLDFTDFSLGNILFSGCFLDHQQDFNRTVKAFSEFCEIKGTVLNATLGEPLVLVGLRKDSSFLPDEASIVGPEAGDIQDLYLLETYIDPQVVQDLPAETRHDYLSKLARTPQLNPEAKAAILGADIVIYGPGTQHSSLFPTYLTDEMGETLVSATGEKIFISNISKDHDIQMETIDSLIDKLVYFVSRKGTLSQVRIPELVTGIFAPNPIQGTTSRGSLIWGSSKYYSIPRYELNWESTPGKHAKSLLADSIINLARKKSQKRIQDAHLLVSIVVPVLNEIRTLDKVITRLRTLDLSELKLDHEIIFVDGGSTDGSLELLKNQSVGQVLTLPNGTGRGEALHAGVNSAKGNIVCIFPSDGEYVEDQIRDILKPILNHSSSFVIGSRSHKCLNLDQRIHEIYGKNKIDFLISKYGGYVLSVLFLFFHNRYITDSLSSMKAFTRQRAQIVPLRKKGLGYEFDLIKAYIKNSEYIAEVPVEFRPRSRAEGKKITLKDGIEAISSIIN